MPCEGWVLKITVNKAIDDKFRWIVKEKFWDTSKSIQLFRCLGAKSANMLRKSELIVDFDT